MGVVMVVATAIALLPDLRPERHAFPRTLTSTMTAHQH